MTSNSNLVKGARDFNDESSFPLAVTAEAVASILWVRSPALAPDVPREMVLASAYVGMQPSPTLWNKYVDEIERLEKDGTVAADDAIVLRSTRLGREALMVESLGDEAAVENDLPLAVLERVHETSAAPLRAQVGKLRAQLADSEAVATHTTADWINQVDARQRAEGIAAARGEMVDEMSDRLRQIEEEGSAKIRRIGERSEKVARRLTRGVAWTGRAVIVGVAAWALVMILSSKDPSTGLPVLILAALSVASFVATFLPPKGWGLATLERYLARSGFRRQLKLAGHDPSEADRPLGT